MGKLAIIGGSGFEKLVEGKQTRIKTKFGDVTLLKGKKSHIGPFDQLITNQVFFLSRHGPVHDIPPHMINHKANMSALAIAGATDLLSISAVGSLDPDKYKVGDIVIVRDYIRFMQGPTLFDSFKGKAMHTPMDEPYSQGLIEKVQKAARLAQVEIKDGAVITDTSGPRFETKAEVRVLASYGVDLAGMTSVSETIIANELRMAGYNNIQNATITIISNLGTGIGNVSHEDVVAVVREKEGQVKGIIYELIKLV